MKTILTTAMVMFMATSTVFAGQNAQSGSNSENTTVVNALAIAGGAGENGGNNGGTTRIANTPDAYAPAVPGGNPCIIGQSAGVSMPGVGLAMGTGYQDKECELRQQAALLANMGLTDASIVLMCQQNPNLHKALVATGYCRSAAPAPTADSARTVSSRSAAPAAEGVCYVKPGTRTVVTNFADKMACARRLGLAG